MAKYKFSSAQRYAIFLTHGMKCYLCDVPLDLTSMTVDHVLPEHLLATPSLAASTKLALGLPASFQLNSFENWMPACGSCNAKKSELQFEPSLLFQVHLQRLVAKAEQARRLCDEIVSNRHVSSALNTLERAQESGRSFDNLEKERMSVLLGFAADRELVIKGEPLRLKQSFQLVVTNVEAATRWGATHWSMPPREPGEPSLVVLFCVERGECANCGLTQRIFQPINQEGGGDPICDACLSVLDWMAPVALGDLPTHVTEARGV